MKIKIEFDTDNGAFDGESLVFECYRVLQNCLEHIDNAQKFPVHRLTLPLADSNGNGIGEIEINRGE